MTVGARAHGCGSACSLIQHAKRTRGVIVPPVTSLAPPYFLTSSHKRYDIRKNVIERKICSDFLYKFYLKHFSFQEEFSEIFL